MPRLKNCECNRCKKEIIKNKSGYCLKCFVITQRELKISNWKESGDTGMKVSTTLRGCIRDYIYKKQNYKCSICGINNKWNDKNINFVLDHIDGDASNNKEENLRLVCPNCDSQLDTFKSKNKNSARSFRKNK